MSENRLVLILPSYDPYKDLFDIFIKQFKKNWPDCPFPLVVSNMNFKYEGNNVFVINCGNEKNQTKRIKRAVEAFEADYYFILEDDRLIMDKVYTKEIYSILEFMDKEKVPYFRCNASIIRKRKRDVFPGYNHYYHILAKEPYGVTGSTVIWSRELIHSIIDSVEDAYEFEANQVKDAALSKERWYKNYATHDSNILHILHCIEKQKWIPSARKTLISEGYNLSNNRREIQSKKERVTAIIKELFKHIPGRIRFVVKKIAKQVGFKFSTDY